MIRGGGERPNSNRGLYGSGLAYRRRQTVELRIAVVVATVAAVLTGIAGFVMGGQVTDPGAGRALAVTTPSSSSAMIGTSARPVDRSGVTVVVANGSGVKGAAVATTTQLKTLGYKTLRPTNTIGVQNGASMLTQVFFAPGSDKAAVQVIADLQLDAVVAQPLPAGPDEIRVALRSRNGADVVVILGN